MAIDTSPTYRSRTATPVLDSAALAAVDTVPAAGRRPVRAAAPSSSDEVLVPDVRAELSPAQSVERKLTSLLNGGAVPVSHLRLAKLCRNL
jgi:hypothetical protein